MTKMTPHDLLVALETIWNAEPPREMGYFEAIDCVTQYTAAIRQAALDDAVNYIDANGKNTGWNQIKFHILHNLKSQPAEPTQ